jgi:ubiquinone/menaquinone biosynthesis C-methylase UbiE
MIGGKLEESWRARYDHWAGRYEADHLIAGWSERGLSRRLALVLRTFEETHLGRGSLVLDLGTGPGTYSRALKGMGHHCVGLDYSWNVIKSAKNKDKTGRYLQGEAYHLPFLDRSFDAVLCVGVLQSLQSIDEAIFEMQRVLKPRGYLLLDGLNSLFWLHGARSLKETLQGLEKRMSYYQPFELAREMETLALHETRIHWLAVPESFQMWLSGERKSQSRMLARLFGHAFLISAQKTT